MNSEYKIATLPKAGTHLLLKCLNSMDALPNLPTSMYGGVTFSDELRSKYGWHLKAEIVDEVTSGDTKYIVMVRDIRDAILSIHNWMPYLYTKTDQLNYLKPFQESFDGNFDDQIQGLIEESPMIDGNFLVRRYHVAQQLHDLSENYPHILFVRYEDLIGSKGGGTSIKQTETILKIGRFLGLDLSQSKVQTIAKEMWGDTETYNVSKNKGKISEWKRKFTAKHIEAVQEHWNEYLLSFGYESEINWHEKYTNIEAKKAI